MQQAVCAQSRVGLPRRADRCRTVTQVCGGGGKEKEVTGVSHWCELCLTVTKIPNNKEKERIIWLMFSEVQSLVNRLQGRKVAVGHG